MATAGCGVTITIGPGLPRKAYTYSSRQREAPEPRRHAARAPAELVKVDAAWMSNYRRLQRNHGNYVIADDLDIKAMPDGSFRVPRTVLKHCDDLGRTPASIAPTPNPELEPWQ